MGVAGFFWDGAQGIDHASAIEIIFSAGEYIDRVWADGQRLWELASLLIAALGFGTHVVGAAKAEAPLALRRRRAEPAEPGQPERVRRTVEPLPADGEPRPTRRRGYFGRGEGGHFIE